jgi:hypothetical protein
MKMKMFSVCSSSAMTFDMDEPRRARAMEPLGFCAADIFLLCCWSFRSKMRYGFGVRSGSVGCVAAESCGVVVVEQKGLQCNRRAGQMEWLQRNEQIARRCEVGGEVAAKRRPQLEMRRVTVCGKPILVSLLTEFGCSFRPFF